MTAPSSLTLEELRNILRGLPSDGAGGVRRAHEDAWAAANTAVSLLQAVECNEARIKELEARVKRVEGAASILLAASEYAWRKIDGYDYHRDACTQAADQLDAILKEKT